MLSTRKNKNTETLSTNNNKYKNFPKYVGRVGGLAGAGIGFMCAEEISAIVHHLSVGGYIPSKRAGIAGALIVGSLGYATGFFAGKVVNRSPIPRAVEKGFDFIKKL